MKLGVTLSEYLNEQGHVITLCESIKCAMEKLNQTNFDIAHLILGFQMEVT